MANKPRAIVPDKGLRAAKNTSGSKISKKTLVKLKDGTVDDEVIPTAAATDAIYGVAYEDIADDAYGDIQVHGRAIVVSAGAVTKGSRVTHGSGAKGAAASGGNSFIGTAVTTAGGADEDIEVELLGPGGAEMPG